MRIFISASSSPSAGVRLPYSPLLLSTYSGLSERHAVYSNSLFATLNARRSTRNINGESIPLSLDASSTGSRTARGTVPHSLAAKAHDISINIEQTTEYSRDAELVRFALHFCRGEG